jgi:hypothetical protein
LGQYLAAGMPIFANRTNFVSDVIQASGAGVVADFSDHEALVLALQEMCANRDQLSEYAKKAKLYFLEYFNWENLSRDYYRKLNSLTASMTPEAGEPIDLILYQVESKELFHQVRSTKIAYITSVIRSLVKRPFPLNILKEIYLHIPYGLLIYIWLKLPGSVTRFLAPRIKRILRGI